MYITLFCSLNEVHSFSILSPFFEFLVISITNVVPYDNKFVVFLTARIAVLKRPLSQELFEKFWKKKSCKCLVSIEKSDAIIICQGQPRPVQPRPAQASPGQAKKALIEQFWIRFESCFLLVLLSNSNHQ